MFEVLYKECTPRRGTKGSSCIDLCASKDVTIGAGETKIVPLGVKINPDELKKIVPIKKYAVGIDKTLHAESEQYYKDVIHNFMESHCLELKCRSSLPLKKGLIIANGVGEIDLDYPKEIGIILHNPITGITMHPAPDCESIQAFTCGNNSSQYFTEIKKGEPIAQIKLVPHKSYLMGYKSDVVREDGYGSTDRQRKIEKRMQNYADNGKDALIPSSEVDRILDTEG